MKLNGGLGFGAVENTCFDELDEFRAGARDDANAAGVAADEAMKFFSGEGDFGCENADGSGFGMGGGRFYGRFHSDEGQGIIGPERANCGNGRGIAGDDDGFGSVTDEVIGEKTGALNDFFEAARAVGAPRGVGDVVQIFIRQQGTDFPQDGEPAETGVENADGVLLHEV